MALQLTGPINMQDLSVEFGGTGALSLNQYYRGGARVPNATPNNAIPTSGTISLGDFYGATNRIAITVTISTNQSNYVFNTAKVPGYVAGITDVTFVINSGVVISSTGTGAYAGNVDTSWAAGDTVRITNNGFILGMGGAGGDGGYYSFITPGTAGSPGGPSFIAQRPVIITNNGTIGGGGGGGGGGQGVRGTGGQSQTLYHSGGGGGGGRTGATNSANGRNNGAAGTFSAAGSGGPGNPVFSFGSVVGTTGVGGAGGNWGSAGGAGGNADAGDTLIGPYSAGSGGAAVVGNANITWLATGTRLGAIS